MAVEDQVQSPNLDVRIEYPGLARALSRQARRRAWRYRRATQLELVLFLVASILPLIAWKNGQVNIALLGAASCFSAGLVIQLLQTLTQPAEDLQEVRGVAEDIKSLAWRYAVGGSPFGHLETARVDTFGSLESGAAERNTEASFLSEFQARIQPFIGHGISPTLLGDHGSLDHPITDGMRRLRAQSLQERMKAYMQMRLAVQLPYLERAARRYRRLAMRWRLGYAFFQVLAVVGLVLRGIGILHIDLFGVAGALGAAGSTWLQTTRYQYLAKDYFSRAFDLSFKMHLLKSDVITTEDGWSQFVPDTEYILTKDVVSSSYRHS